MNCHYEIVYDDSNENCFVTEKCLGSQLMKWAISTLMNKEIMSDKIMMAFQKESDFFSAQRCKKWLESYHPEFLL